MRTGRVIDADTSRTIFSQVLVASTPLDMLLGMIVDRHEFDAMLFPHTRVIHTFCMRFPIDVIFVSKNMEIVEVATKIRPNRVISGPKGTSFVLETISVARNVDRDISVGAKIKIDFI